MANDMKVVKTSNFHYLCITTINKLTLFTMKNFIALIMIAAFFTISCNNTQTNKKEVIEEKKAECGPSISVDSFLVIAANNIGKELTVKGTIDHVCKHGGKRVKIFSNCPSKSIHGEAGEGFGAFKAELEGSEVCLTGTVLETRIDMTYVDEWEAKVKKAMDEEAEEAEMDHKKGVDHHATLEKIKKHREEIEASENGYIAFYALEVNKYTECKTEEAKPCCSGNKTEKAEKSDCGDKKEEAKETADTPCPEKEASKGCCDKNKTGEKKPCESKS